MGLTRNLLAVAQADAATVLEKVASRPTGLTPAEVQERRAVYGKNVVAQELPPPWWQQLARAFVNPFIFILFVLGLVTLFTDVLLATPGEADWTQIAILAIMIGVSGGLTFWQEFRSRQAAEALKRLIPSKATVWREIEGESRPRIVPLSDLVPGDVVQLAAGDMVPADIRLLTSKDLSVSQSALTGESMPVEKYDTLADIAEKSAEPDEDAADLLERETLCFMGTNVMSGAARGVVINTGNRTFFGSMAASVLGERAETSFDRGVNSVSWLLVKLMLVMVPVVLLLNGLTKGDWLDASFFALAVAVGLTPEMLPMIVSANLAKGAIVMSEKKVIVKRIHAIQNFGAMNILCTDKTGTLTEDKIQLETYIDASGRASDDVLELAWLNSAYQTGLRNLLDQAVIDYVTHRRPAVAERLYTKVDEIPFDFDRRRMSVVVENGDGRRLLVCKGAVEEMLEVSGYVDRGDPGTPLSGAAGRNRVPLEEGERRRLQLAAETYNRNGVRIIGVAYRELKDDRDEYGVEDEADLVMAGFIGFLDPPKDSARAALAALHENGVGVKILTGDNDAVTAKVCREVGIDPGRIILGHEIDLLDDEALGELAEAATVFAKVNPLQKARIIRALKDNGHTVGYMGDGINDAAALREADVGVSVDTGVDIAKESADIILLEKDLMVLEEGVVEGRKVFGNIIKYLKMTVSSNFGNVFSVLLASAFLPFLPMTAMQLLVQNLLYDISQISIPWDHMDEEFLRTPRKWDAGSIARFMVYIGPISSIFDATTFALMWYVFGAQGPEGVALFQSGWFVVGLLTQTLIVHMIRTEKVPFVQSTAAWPVLLLTGAVMLLGLFIPGSAFGARIGFTPLPGAYWPWLAATLLAYGVVTQLAKRAYVGKFQQWL